MLIKAIEVGYLQTNCYVVADEATLDAAVIDPGADSNLILDYIERCHFHVRAILLTHGHFDHCMGLEEVYDATGATVYMSHADLTTDIGNGMFGNEDFELDPPDDTVFVREGDVIEAGSLTFDVLETPGHTPGGITYRCEDCLFTGDTLFRMSCGRYDFPAAARSISATRSKSCATCPAITRSIPAMRAAPRLNTSGASTPICSVRGICKR